MKITDAAQKTLFQWKQPQSKQVIKADAAYIVNHMASDPKASYLPGSCSETNCTSLGRGGYKFHRYNGWNFAVKTGTTNDGYDGLMASWSTKYAVVSWVGHHTRRVTLHSSMENLTEPMTRGMMEYGHADAKAANWTQPSTIKTAPAFVVRNHIGFGSVEPSVSNDIYPGWYAGGGSTKNTAQTIDKVSGKVATTCTPPLAKSYAANSNAASWNADIFNGGRTSINSGSSGSSKPGAAATDDVHNCNDSPPTVTLTAPGTCDTSCTITATVTQGTHPLSDNQYPQFPGNIVFTLNGQTIHSRNISDSPSTISFTYNPTSSGSGTVKAVVTDSVLYQGSASSPMSFTVAAPAAQTLTLTLGSHSGGSASLSWNNIGASSYSVCYSGPKSGCNSVSGTSTTITGLTPGNYSAYVTATGTTSNTVTWSQ